MVWKICGWCGRYVDGVKCFWNVKKGQFRERTNEKRTGPAQDHQKLVESKTRV